SRGHERQDEASTAQIDFLGMTESNLIFLGYPDGYLEDLRLNYPNSGDQLTTHNGQSETYGTRGLGGADYHTYRFGSAADYNRHNILTDLQDILVTYQPDHIYVTHEQENHSDHATTSILLVLALDQAILSVPGYNPTIHKTIVWPDTTQEWPNATDPTAYFDEIPDLSGSGLLWSERESLDVPLALQSENFALNPKYQAVGAHGTQGAVNGYIGRFVHKDEFFWPEVRVGSNDPPVADAGTDQAVSEGAFVILDGTGSFDPDLDPLTYAWTQIDGPTVVLSDSAAASPSFTVPTGQPDHFILTFELVVGDGVLTTPPDTARIDVSAALAPVYGPNAALGATATASTQRTNSEAFKAIDGFPIGYPEDETREWVTASGTDGAWIQLDWASPITIGRIVLFDRPNDDDHVEQATLSFSDGSSLVIGPLDNWGRSSIYEFSTRTIDQVRLTVDSASPDTRNIGLSEFEVREITGGAANQPPVAHAGTDQSVDEGVTVQLDGSGSSDPDTDPLTFDWFQTGGTAVSLSDPVAESPSFTAPSDLTANDLLTFRLIVNDGTDDSLPDLVDITVIDYPDADGDTYPANLDCDDTDPLINPGAAEITCNSIDENCNGAADDTPDADGDTYSECVDCNDADPLINPGATEITCNGIDENCNGAADDTPDADGDTYTVCDGDCDDTNPAINPGATEITCNSIDENCNGAADDTPDADGDTHSECVDCNDADPLINPGATEITCNGIDENCNGAADDTPDVDGDTYTVCDGDCNDADPAINPGATEITCNSIDENCNGAVDDTPDVDGDTYSECVDCNDTDPLINPGATEITCNSIDENCNGAADDTPDVDGDTFTVCAGDCDDTDPLINPAATEITCNSIDENCNGAADDTPDVDGDTYTVCVDCDDADPLINPGATEVTCNSIDENCNGATDDTPDADGDTYSECVDCNDTNPLINPGTTEITCNSIDENCNGAADDTPDVDGDTYSECVDCNDTDPLINPGATEITCNSIDENCNGVLDDEPDGDSDTYSICNDCDDTDPLINPAATEITCNSIDENCNGAADDTPDVDGDTYTVCDGDCN
ncbi:MAG: PIG-L family deacetylase, partial [Acidobacteria bacterium]|nr:PIG-L family deacetylase [Candidatus Polarisedimenticola svalbardensis]